WGGRPPEASTIESGGGVWGGRPPEASTVERLDPGSRPSGRVWTVTLLMMSCRAMGRGVIEALLAWLARSAARGGARARAVPCLVPPRSGPRGLALAASGFRAPEDAGPAGRPHVARFAGPLSGPPPPLPGWVTAPGEP